MESKKHSERHDRAPKNIKNGSIARKISRIIVRGDSIQLGEHSLLVTAGYARVLSPI